MATEAGEEPCDVVRDAIVDAVHSSDIAGFGSTVDSEAVAWKALEWLIANPVTVLRALGYEQVGTRIYATKPGRRKGLRVHSFTPTWALSRPTEPPATEETQP